MRQKFTLTMDNTPVLNRPSYPKMFNAIWCMAALLVLLSIGCKKDKFVAVQGVCPTVLTDPMDKAVDVALNKVITATFNTPMDSTTINNSTFVIKQGATTIGGKIATTANPAVYTFTPTVALLPFAVYTGTITTSAADRFHTALTSDFVWTFTTIPQITVTVSPVAGGVTTGAGNFAQGSTTTVTATPNTGFTFKNWTNADATVASVSANYQFVVAGNRTLTANFVAVPAGQFAVVVSAVPVNGGTTAGSGSYDAGTNVTVTATPSAGFSFVNWKNTDGSIASVSPAYTFQIVANRTLTATFSAVPASQFALVLSSSPIAGGSTTGSGSYSAGTSVTATATANPGYTFVNWTDNGAIVSTSAAYTFPLAANRALVANFTLNTYTLNVIATNGAVDKNPNQAVYNFGTTVALTATPNAGFTFTSWSGDATGNANPLSVVMNANKNITANFTQNTYTLNVTATNGTVAKNPSLATYNSGSTVTLTATPNAGFTFSSWTGDASGSANPLSVLMNANKNITANFIATPATPPLFSSIFGAFGGAAGITNQGINTVINNGSIGTTAAATLITGFHDGLTADVYTETPLNVGLVTGGIYSAPPFPGTAAKFNTATLALAAANAFYISISPANRPGGTDPGAGELGNLTLAPGTYKSAGGSFKITNGNLTLDAQGDPNAVWVFQAPTSLTVGIAGPAGARSVLLVNGAKAQNVYWYVGSAATINAAGGGVMVGTIISSAGVTFSTAGNTVQTVLNGRAISLVASVTMVNTTINTQ
ncbi:InlB B-repeat-containing protein [Mucilaginibacter sp. UYCu711]|uniref:InlB B-repeat-containing protein n=1 Tax=Mucilaginibacter sp. UYCu711 TaxID=3156339 RepID=UPI003D191058